MFLEEQLTLRGIVPKRNVYCSVDYIGTGGNTSHAIYTVLL